MSIRLTSAVLFALAFPALALAQAGRDGATGQPQPLEPAPDRAAAPLPPADEIIQRHIEARGGERALREKRSTLKTGTYEWPLQAHTSSIILKYMAPDRVWLELTNHMARGRRVACYDGEFAWEFDDVLGAQPSTPPDQTNSYNYDYYSELNYPEHYTSIETIDRTQFEEKAAFKVRVIDLAGQERFQYFDVETGLLVGVQTSTSTAQGIVTMTTVYDGWETVDGVTTHMQELTFRSQPGMSRQLVGIAEFDEIEFNTLDQSDFAMPPEVFTALKPMIDEARRQQGEEQGAGPQDNGGEQPEDGQ